MKIDLTTLSREWVPVELELDPVEIDLDSDGGAVLSAARLSGSLRAGPRGGELTGNVIAVLTVPCSRCLEPVRVEIDEPFVSVFVLEDPADGQSNVELDERQFEETLATDGKVDLVDTVREQIFLAVPEQIFCREACLGLCPKCGANRNLVNCRCEDEGTDPRWAALKSLE